MLRKQHFVRVYCGVKSVLLYCIKAKAFDKLKSGISSSMASFLRAGKFFGYLWVYRDNSR